MLLEKLKQDQITALKAGDKETKTILTNLISAIKNAEIEKRQSLTEKEQQEVIIKCQKMAKEQITTCNPERTDLLDKYNKELEIISRYTPSITERLTERIVDVCGNEKIKDKTKPIIGFMKKEQIEKEEFLKIAYNFCLTNEEVEVIVKSL